MLKRKPSPSLVVGSVALTSIAGTQQTITLPSMRGHLPRQRQRAPKLQTIADDLGKQLKMKVNVEIVTDYAALERGWPAKTYDLAFVHPPTLRWRQWKRGEYTLAAVSKAHTGYKGIVLSKVNAPAATPADLGKTLASGSKPVAHRMPTQLPPWLIKATCRRCRCASRPLRRRSSSPAIRNPFPTCWKTASSMWGHCVRKQSSGTGRRPAARSSPPRAPCRSKPDRRQLARERQYRHHRNYFVDIASSADGRAKLEKIGLNGASSHLRPEQLRSDCRLAGALSRCDPPGTSSIKQAARAPSCLDFGRGQVAQRGFGDGARTAT